MLIYWLLWATKTIIALIFAVVWSVFNRKRSGLLPVAIQEKSSGQILILASVDKEAFDYTVRHKVAAFYSTSRKKIWIKGESSGNFLKLLHILVDCGQDALEFQVSLEKGGVCHTINQNKETGSRIFTED